MRHGQGRRVINLFWETVLVSALNERIGQMDVGYARKVFLDGFLRNRDGFQLEIPLVPLGELYGTRLESWLRESGCHGSFEDRNPRQLNMIEEARLAVWRCGPANRSRRT